MRAFTLCLVLGLAFAACDATSPSAESLLTAGPWAPRSADTVPIGTATRYEFRADGTLDLTFANGEEETEAWVLEEDDAVLVIQDGTASLRLSVLRLTADELVLERPPMAPGAGALRFELVRL